jgi:hypothetical protein
MKEIFVCGGGAASSLVRVAFVAHVKRKIDESAFEEEKIAAAIVFQCQQFKSQTALSDCHWIFLGFSLSFFLSVILTNVFLYVQKLHYGSSVLTRDICSKCIIFFNFPETFSLS